MPPGCADRTATQNASWLWLTENLRTGQQDSYAILRIPKKPHARENPQIMKNSPKGYTGRGGSEIPQLENL
jgi:hypothetical protein